MPGGVFITFEGGDGVGKSTHLRRLADRLRAEGREVVTTREPGGTSLGRELRELVLHGTTSLADRAEALIFAADRAQHIHELVRPALARGAVVLQDRYFDSSIVYQGAGRGLGAERIRELSMWAADGLMPQMTLLFDLAPEDAADRMRAGRGGLDRLEAAGLEFHTSVREAFLALAAAEPQRIRVIDASRDEDAVAAAVNAAVAPLLASAPCGATPSSELPQ